MTKSKRVGWRSPSNIAIVKYWGKHGVQLPNNASLSLTLDKCYTETKMDYYKSDKLVVDFKFDGKTKKDFAQRITTFLNTVFDKFPFLGTAHLSISSHNSFPHSAGIASSASSMSALALCLCSMQEEISGDKLGQKEFFQKASEIARLASGSASRSVYGGYSAWGKHEDLSSSSNRFAIEVNDVHENFKDYNDAILIVHAGVKTFSSTKGHGLMTQNPYSEVRYANAKQQLSELLFALQKGDVPKFIEISEKEALTLHAMMMVSGEGYFEMRPNSLEIMQRVRKFRYETQIPVAYTLDAGPNVHLLYPQQYKEKVLPFIKKELMPFCQDGKWIDDKIGFGPVKL